MPQITKKYTFIFAAAIAAASLAGIGTSRAIEESADTQVETMKSKCTELTSSLSQLERSDTLLRNNIGDAYLTVSKELMVPLNQRIAANQLDGGALVEIAAKYKDTYDDEFYVDFKEYEISLSETLKISCRDQPREFYEGITESRDKRKKLYRSSKKIISLAQEYKKEYVAFKKQMIKDAQ